MARLWWTFIVVSCVGFPQLWAMTGPRIGSFNTGGFSESKSKNTDFMGVFVQIIQRYDIIFLQEIRDAQGDGMANLKNALNNQYGVEISGRLGGSMKEQYAFLYRKNAGISVVGTYQVPDSSNLFVREPFAVRFNCTRSALSSFVLIGLRAHTSAVQAELNQLDNARTSVISALNENNVIMLGDWHADCSALSQTKLKSLDLKHDGEYSSWLIPDTADTTISTSSCAYDRIVVSGPSMSSAIVTGSTVVFHFDNDASINMGTLAGTNIADNYPVEFALKARSLRIAAFNVRVFGTTKASKPHIMDTLVKIIQRYDVLFLQEIRDSTYCVLPQLNNTIQLPGQRYTYVNSTRLGRTSAKEQYAYFYRTDVGLTLTDTYQDPDPADVFERPPYAARFLHKPSDSSSGTIDFFFLGVHVRPSDAFDEINGLDEVRAYLSSSAMWGLSKSIIMGDLNADCSYLSQKATDLLDLKTDGSHWLIADGVDTTVAASSCSYDRFVATAAVLTNVEPLSTGVFRFDTEYGLNSTEAAEVSDHFPIELVLMP